MDLALCGQGHGQCVRGRANVVVDVPGPGRVKEPDVDWRDSARCLDEDPDLFFPIGSSGPALAQADRAKGVCRQCSVLHDCLDWALSNYQDSGVWGGTTEEERRVMRRLGVTSASAALAVAR
jgi:WhiB family redox-sensing transcriptional regulator